MLRHVRIAGMTYETATEVAGALATQDAGPYKGF